MRGARPGLAAGSGGPAAELGPGRSRGDRPGDRVPGRPSARRSRRHRARPRPDAVRRGVRPAADHGLPPGRCRESWRGAARPPDRRAAGRLRRAAAVRADPRPDRGQRADHGRDRPAPPDAAAAAGRGRLGQDPGRPAGDVGGGRGRRPGRAAGADRGAGRSALPDGAPAAGRSGRRRHPGRGRARDRRRPDHRVDGRRPEAGGHAAGRLRGGRPGDRHPCPAQQRGAVRRSRAGRGGRAAPLRGGTAGRVERQSGRPAARAGDDGDADSPLGRDDGVR